MRSQQVVTEVRNWLFPTLVIVIGWLIKDKMNDIDNRLALIPLMQGSVTTVQKDQAVMSLRIDVLTERVTKLEGKKEDEYEFPKRKK